MSTCAQLCQASRKAQGAGRAPRAAYKRRSKVSCDGSVGVQIVMRLDRKLSQALGAMVKYEGKQACVRGQAPEVWYSTMTGKRPCKRKRQRYCKIHGKRA